MLRCILVGLVAVAAGAAAGPAAAAPPPNDTSAGATVIGSLPYAVEVDTTEATLGDDDRAIRCTPDPGTQTFSHSVWFSYTPAEDEALVVDTSGSDYATAGAIFPAGAPESTVACFLSGTTVPLEGGTTYLIDILEFGDAGGGMLHLSLSSLPLPELTLARVGGADRAGTATLSGTVTCEPGWTADVYGGLTQVVGRRTATSAFNISDARGLCDGTAQPWTIVLTPFSGRFRPGPAGAQVTVQACTEEFTCTFAEVSTGVTLRRTP